ncbi:MAG TPA: NAD-glutamate dehydrogenase [Mycobacteriales bacterium]|nr:NAD-glutamate dehydrogenase [Mycobacteriales bacterium]
MAARHDQAKEEAKAELIVAAAALAREDPRWADGRLEQVETFVHHYYRFVAADDLVSRDAADVLGAAVSHLQLAERRTPGTGLVRVVNPSTELDGWQSPHSVVEVVTDDMPFLVDSVTAELTRHNLGIHLVVHPQMQIGRDAVGQLLDLAGPDDTASQRSLESFIHVEIDRLVDPATAEQLRKDLRRVLEDVRAAVEDWSKMQRRAAEAVTALESYRPAGSVEAVQETAALLEWMRADNFIFLGYREYRLTGAGADQILATVPGTGLGILRDAGLAPESRPFGTLPPGVRRRALDDNPLILTKANTRATVNRAAYLDYVGVKVYDDAGQAVGERRFLGLFRTAAYRASPSAIPVARRKAAAVMRRADFAPGSHDARDLAQILDTYPLDELLQISEDDLFSIAMGILHLQERRQVRLFIRHDTYGRFISCLVFLPRERYTTAVRLRIQEILVRAVHGTSVDYTTSVSESVLARLHIVVRTDPAELQDVDLGELESRLAAATRSWNDELADAITAEVGEGLAASLISRYSDFPEAYKEDFSARRAVVDLLRLETLGRSKGDLDVTLYRPSESRPDERRFKIFRVGGPLSLSEIMPVLQNMGVEVLDERPYEIARSGEPTAWIYDLGLRLSEGVEIGTEEREAFQDAFTAVWRGKAESHRFNALVLAARLSWREVSVLRAYAKYLRQTGTAFSEMYIAETLARNVGVAGWLVDLFLARFNPALAADESRSHDLIDQIGGALANVASLDEDRILRSYLALISATVRTNYFQVGADGEPKEYLSLKLDPERVPDLPVPRPKHEIFVYSPRMEGVHLRFGAVARGGIRWSDRREDFRTEVLGLVKAQMVKNAVIVPVGAKGGFVVKRPRTDREAMSAEVVACYSDFIRGLLDLTDNLVDGAVVPPTSVVRHDGDDPYLVVAADKGTGTFSDIANAIAIQNGFWLGDAFASGGSAGYDHKAMGITARGAWESVKWHFREIGTDISTQPFTVAGIGDMSGDVFGNGMLLSRQIRLVAAFDHRHIFLDPAPDAATSYVERERLFELPRSSWDDYDRALLSAGGGIFPRTAKSIPISPEVAAALGISVAALTPAELMRAILLAPVDLLWNGGIGTYVKAATETHADAGDKANDAVRVDGRELRCKVVGEGGNLGLTQRGRVEYALAGGRVNTDAIDNSAGVDTSDHEVNIKILLGQVVAAGEMTLEQRDALLEEMTDEVAAHVLRDNYEQNVALGNARFQAHDMLPVYARYISRMEKDGHVDRSLAVLPDEVEIARREAAGIGLTSPEFAVVLAHTKIALTAALLASDLPEDPYLSRELAGYFPTPLRTRFARQMLDHRLRREIITTVVVNGMVNHAGITFLYRMAEETASSPADITRAHTAAREIFAMPSFMAEVEELDNVVPTSVQTSMLLEGRKLMERATRWLLHSRRSPLDIAASIVTFAPGVAEVVAGLPGLVLGPGLDAMVVQTAQLEQAGVPESIARRVAGFGAAYGALDIVDVASRSGAAVSEVGQVYFALEERLELHRLRGGVLALPREDRWQTLARAALRDELYAAHAVLTADVLATTEPGEADKRIDVWCESNAAAVGRATQVLADITTAESYNLATLSVALRQVRGLAHSSALSQA